MHLHQEQAALRQTIRGSCSLFLSLSKISINRQKAKRKRREAQKKQTAPRPTRANRTNASTFAFALGIILVILALFANTTFGAEAVVFVKARLFFLAASGKCCRRANAKKPSVREGES